MKFCEQIPNSLRTRIKRGSFQIYLKNGFLGLQNTVVLLGHMEKNLFFNFESYDFENGKE
jgi:hypothetical protein